MPDEPKEIKTLYKRFRRLDLGQRGTLGDDDLLRIPEVIMNPLAPRLIAIFDRNADGRIDFRAFARALSLFNERSSPQVKIDGKETRVVIHTSFFPLTFFPLSNFSSF